MGFYEKNDHLTVRAKNAKLEIKKMKIINNIMMMMKKKSVLLG